MSYVAMGQLCYICPYEALISCFVILISARTVLESYLTSSAHPSSIAKPSRSVSAWNEIFYHAALHAWGQINMRHLLNY